jgi:hypothetical protein
MCNCGKNKTSGPTATGGRVTVQTPNGLRISKPSLTAAEAYVSGHPGAKIV